MQCSCGFTCGTQTVYTRHLRRFAEAERQEHCLVALLDAEGAHGEELDMTEEPGWSLLHSRPRSEKNVDTAGDSDLSATASDGHSYSEEQHLHRSPPSTPTHPHSAHRLSTQQDPTAFPIHSFSLESSPMPPERLSAGQRDPPAYETEEHGGSLPFELEGANTDCVETVEHDHDPANDGVKSPHLNSDPPSPAHAETPVGLRTGGFRRTGAPPPSTFASAVQMASDISSMRMFQLRSMAMSIVGLDPNDASTPRVRHISISTAKDAIMWVDPWLSLKVFGVGMYGLLCLQHFVHGALVQPSCVLAYSALMYLGFNVICRQWSNSKENWGRDHDIRAQQFTTDLLFKLCTAVVPLIGAVAGLVVRTLSGRHLATTIWTSLALALVLLVGQLQLVGQVTLAMCVWTGLFTLPWMYRCCHYSLDALAEEMVHLGSLYLGMFPRTVHCVGLSSGIISAVLIDASGLVRIASGASVYTGFLFWSYLRLHPSPAAVTVSDG